MEKKKSFNEIVDVGLGCAFLPFAVVSSIFAIPFVFMMIGAIPSVLSGDAKSIILVLSVSLFCVITYWLMSHQKLKGRVEDRIRKIDKKETELIAIYDKNYDELKNEFISKRSKLDIEYSKLKKQENDIIAFNQNILKTKYPFNIVASLYSDAVDTVLKETENRLRTKIPNAPKSADQVKEIRKMVNELIAEGKVSQYKYELLLSYVPNLEDYAKDDDLFDIVEDYYAQNKEDEYDRVRDYLSKDEYNKLSEDERSQLALDRYINSKKKSKWQIGRDYELYCGYMLREKDYKVEQYGCKHGVEDLGRDIIAHKNGKTYIIQCKYWSKNKVIREKYIMQLFGTKVEYELTHPHLFDKVYAVFVTNIELSEMAVKFANHLHVIVKNVQMGTYPVIKCNINNGNKIYHLPFDQQYDRTEIKYAGEFWAATVKEAVAKGFRRAHRHFFDNS